MADELGPIDDHDYGEPDPLANKHDNAYGDMGYYAGQTAHRLLEALSKPLLKTEYDRQHGWYWAEDDALALVSELEMSAPHIRATGEVLVAEMDQFHTGITAVRLALPLTEAERVFLREDGPDVLLKDILQYGGDFIAQGVRQPIDGRDMVRRWLAWRRETDEFAGQGTLDVAREALRGIVQLLQPNERLPIPYRQLRGIPVDPAEYFDPFVDLSPEEFQDWWEGRLPGYDDDDQQDD